MGVLVGIAELSAYWNALHRATGVPMQNATASAEGDGSQFDETNPILPATHWNDSHKTRRNQAKLPRSAPPVQEHVLTERSQFEISYLGSGMRKGFSPRLYSSTSISGFEV
jgi:hypothetical protein